MLCDDDKSMPAHGVLGITAGPAAPLGEHWRLEWSMVTGVGDEKKAREAVDEACESMAQKITSFTSPFGRPAFGETIVYATFGNESQTKSAMMGEEAAFVAKVSGILEANGIENEIFPAPRGVPKKGDKDWEDYADAVARFSARMDAKHEKEELDGAARPGAGGRTGARI